MADVWLELDRLLDRKLFRVCEENGRGNRQQQAAREGVRLKALMGALRFLWRNTKDKAHHPEVALLKSHLQESPQQTARREANEAEAEEEEEEELPQAPLDDHDGSGQGSSQEEESAAGALADRSDAEAEEATRRSDGEASSHSTLSAPTKILGQTSPSSDVGSDDAAKSEAAVSISEGSDQDCVGNSPVIG